MYPTDLSNTQWQFVKKSIHIEDRKRKYDLREIWNSINYLVKTGCQWRMLPTNFPKWQLVYYYIVVRVKMRHKHQTSKQSRV